MSKFYKDLARFFEVAFEIFEYQYSELERTSVKFMEFMRGYRKGYSAKTTRFEECKDIEYAKIGAEEINNAGKEAADNGGV